MFIYISLFINRSNTRISVQAGYQNLPRLDWMPILGLVNQKNIPTTIFRGFFYFTIIENDKGTIYSGIWLSNRCTMFFYILNLNSLTYVLRSHNILQLWKSHYVRPNSWHNPCIRRTYPELIPVRVSCITRHVITLH